MTGRLAWWLIRGAPAPWLILILCLAVAVAGRVAVAALGGAVETVVVLESRGILGGDLELSSAAALTPDQQAALARVTPAGSRVAEVRSCTTMATVAAPRANPMGTGGLQATTRAVDLRAVPPGWPMVGTLVLAPAVDLQAGTWCAVQPELLRQLGVAVGDDLRLGSATVRIAAVIAEEPGAVTNPFQLGPRVLVSQATLDASGLAGFGARIRHSRLVVLPAPDRAAETARDFHRALGQDPDLQPLPGSFGPPLQGVTITTAADAQGRLLRILERLGDWLRLASLLTLMLGGLGMATLTHGTLARTAEDRAVLAVLGAGPGRLARVVLVQMLGVGLAGGLLGSVLGAGIAAVVIRASGLATSAVTWPTVVGGIALAVVATLVFAAGPLLQAAVLRPLAVLRGESPPPTKRLAWAWAGTVVLLLAVAAVETRSLVLGPAVVGGAVLAGGILAGVFRLGLPGVAVLAPGRRGPWRFALGHGLANLGRPGLRTIPAATALGLAAVLLGVLMVYRASVTGALAAESRGELPTLFAIDLQDDQVADFRAATAGERAELAPVVRARYRGLVGRTAPADTAAGSGAADEAKFLRSREQNLSWREVPGADETLTAGRWATGAEECTLEVRFAERIGAGVGDRIAFDIQGVPLELTVTGLRQVRWLGFRPNFFILTSPAALAGAPTTWIAALAPPGDRLAVQVRLTERFPNLTILDLAAIARRIQGLTDRLAWAVGGLAGAALVAGVLVLVGMVLESARRRREDAAVLACLGLPRGPLVLSLGVEFAVLGLVAGAGGLLVSVPAGIAVVQGLLHLPVTVPWGGIAVVLPVFTGVTAVAGVLAAGDAIRAKPLEALRSA